MQYYDEIKQELINNEITKKIKDYSKNKSDLTTYYNVGKLLSDAGKHYGEGIIKEYSIKLTNELGKGYSKRNLWLMLKFYETIKKMQTLSAQCVPYTEQKWSAMSSVLTWSHYTELLKYNDINQINYYIKISIEQNLSVRELRQRIKDNEYERLPKTTKEKLIIIKNNNKYEIISEKILQKIILEDIESFMKKLGNSFCFIGSEYKIKLGDKYNYIDLLLFNIEFNFYTVVKLKVTELKKGYIGQITTYMNYIDKNVKKENQNKTIGIIICKKDNKFIMEYCSDPRVFSKEYVLN